MPQLSPHRLTYLCLALLFTLSVLMISAPSSVKKISTTSTRGSKLPSSPMYW